MNNLFKDLDYKELNNEVIEEITAEIELEEVPSSQEEVELETLPEKIKKKRKSFLRLSENLHLLYLFYPYKSF